MNKRGLLIYPSTTPRGNNAFGWFREAAARHGMSVEVLFYDAPAAEAPAGAPAWKPDFVLMRGYNIALSRWYEAQGVPVLNAPEAMILCRDKLRCGEVLAAAGVPVPGALSPEKARSGDAFPFILKLNFGSKGENVFLVRDVSEYRSALEACRREEALRLEALSRGISEFGETPEEVCRGCEPVLQEFVATSSGRDIRVWVTGDEVAGHVLRYNPSSFKSNFAAGGSFRQIPLPPAAASLAVAAARACGLFFAGVDLLFDGDAGALADCSAVSHSEDPSCVSAYTGGFKVCEVNGNAGFRTASADIPDALFRNLARKFSYNPI